MTDEHYFDNSCHFKHHIMANLNPKKLKSYLPKFAFMEFEIQAKSEPNPERTVRVSPLELLASASPIGIISSFKNEGTSKFTQDSKWLLE